MKKSPPVKKDTSWDSQANWYNRLVGDDGSSYHKEVILPKTLKLLQPVKNKRILDLGCGQGVFSRWLAKTGAKPVGVDLSNQLIQLAKSYEKHNQLAIDYYVADACNLPPKLKQGQFDSAVSVLSLGNMESFQQFFIEAKAATKAKSNLVIVVMHPCFRIPRQSHWQFDEDKKLQYRRVDRYLSSLSIPIITHPGKDKADYTTMFHRPISAVIQAASNAGWLLKSFDEWTSNRISKGAKAKSENRARQEFPLFAAFHFVSL